MSSLKKRTKQVFQNPSRMDATVELEQNLSFRKFSEGLLLALEPLQIRDVNGDILAQTHHSLSEWLTNISIHGENLWNIFDILSFLETEAILNDATHLATSDSCFMLINPSSFVVADLNDITKPLIVNNPNVSNLSCGIIAEIHDNPLFILGTSTGSVEIWKIVSGDSAQLLKNISFKKTGK